MGESWIRHLREPLLDPEVQVVTQPCTRANDVEPEVEADEVDYECYELKEESRTTVLLKKIFRKKTLLITFYLAMVIITGTLNQIASRITAVPMGRYQYFLTNFTSVCYVGVYFVIVLFRVLFGSVDKKMLTHKIMPFVFSGFMDALYIVLSTIPRRALPGALLPLLMQTILPFSMLSSFVVLRQRFSLGQLIGSGLVMIGAVTSIVPELSCISCHKGSLGFMLMFAMSTLPQSLSCVTKEKVFKKFPAMDIFVVCLFGSFFQLIWTVLMMPLVSIPGFGQIPITQLPGFFANGMQCLVGISPSVDDHCGGNPYAPVVYIVVNLAFNIFLMLLLKSGGTLLMFLGIMVTIPFSSLAFALEWPLLGAQELSLWVILALVIIMAGLIIYRLFPHKPKQAEIEINQGCCVVDDDEEHPLTEDDHCTA